MISDTETNYYFVCFISNPSIYTPGILTTLLEKHTQLKKLDYYFS